MTGLLGELFSNAMVCELRFGGAFGLPVACFGLLQIVCQPGKNHITNWNTKKLLPSPQTGLAARVWEKTSYGNVQQEWGKLK